MGHHKQRASDELVKEDSPVIDEALKNFKPSAAGPTAPRAWIRNLKAVALAILPSFLHPRSAHTHPTRLKRTAWLDGLRGIAALCVFWFHMSFRTFVTVDGYGYTLEHLQILRLPYIRLIYSGAPWVAIFFIISGYVLSVRPLKQMRAGEFDTFQKSMASAIFRRPIRLYGPCIISSFIVFVIVRLGLYEWTRPIADSIKVFPVQPHETHVVRMASFFPQLAEWAHAVSELIHNAFYDNFFGGNFPYDVHLWTIPIEFRASMQLFLTLVVLARMDQRMRTSSLAFLIWFSLHGGKWEMMLFYSGAIIAELDLSKPPSSRPHADSASLPKPVYLPSPTSSSAGTTLILTVTLLTGLYFASFPEEHAETTPGFMLLDRLVPSTIGQRYRFWHSVGAVQIVWALSNAPTLQRAVFNSRLVQYLGRISYGLYLMHGPVVHTFGYAVLPFWLKLLGTWWGFFWAGACITLAVVWAGDLFERFGDRPCVRFARWAAVWFGVEDG